MSKSVKLKELIKSMSFKQVSGDEESLEREILIDLDLSWQDFLNIRILEELFCLVKRKLHL